MKQLKIHKKAIVFYFTLFIAGCIIIPNFFVWGSSDRNCWVTWTNYIQHFGIQNIYKIKADYPPLAHYVFFIFSKFNTQPEDIFLNIIQLKYFIFFIEILGVFFMYLVLHSLKIKNAVFLPLLILFNISYWYNNFFFGQFDGVHTAFAFISVCLAAKNRLKLSLIFLVLSLNFKFQGIIFLPIVLLIIFNKIETFNLKKVFGIICPAVLFQVLLYIPFIFSGDFKLAIESSLNGLNRYPFVSMGAFNIWSIVFEDPQHINDNSFYYFISVKNLGLLTFFTLSIIVLLPLILTKSRFFGKYITFKISIENVLLVSVLIILLFFYTNTQMHSRYSHPLVLFSGCLSIIRKDYFRFSLVSLAVFLNMEGFSRIIKGNIMEYNLFWFKPEFVSFLFLSLIFLYTYDYLIQLLPNGIKMKFINQDNTYFKYVKWPIYKFKILKTFTSKNSKF